MSKRKGKKHRSVSQKQQFLAYSAENRQETNKIAKMASHVKRNPNDEKAVKNLERVRSVGQTWKRTVNRASNFVPERTQLEAAAIRATSTGAVMLDGDGKSIQKNLPRIRRGKFVTLMARRFKELGIEDGRFYRALQA